VTRTSPHGSRNPSSKTDWRVAAESESSSTKSLMMALDRFGEAAQRRPVCIGIQHTSQASLEHSIWTEEIVDLVQESGGVTVCEVGVETAQESVPPLGELVESAGDHRRPYVGVEVRAECLPGGGQHLFDLEPGFAGNLVDGTAHTCVDLGEIDAQAHRQQTPCPDFEHPAHHVDPSFVRLDAQQLGQDAVVDL